MKLAQIIVGIFAISSLPLYAQSKFDRPPEQITQDCASYIDKFNQQLESLTTAKSAATYQTVMRPFDQYLTEFADELLHDYLMQNVHVDEDVRKASSDCSIKTFAIFTSMSMNRPLYEKISQISTENLPPAQAFTVNYWKASFQASGIGKDQPTRDKIQALNDEVTVLNNQFSQNITDDVRSIKVKPERLDGLPADYIESHPVDENGLVTVTTAYSDIGPIYKYAHDRQLRKDVMLMSNNRAYPQNKPLLMEILQKRFQLAQTLDHDNYAQLDMIGTMVGTPDKAEAFASTLSKAIKQPVQNEKARLLKRMQKLDAKTNSIESYDTSYIANIIRQEDYQLDAKEVRQYFDYDKVRDGILKLSEDLFNLEIKPYTGAKWHTSVEAYDVYEKNKLIGRFFFDSHPRKGKFTHAAQFGINLGKKDYEIPQAALVMNFPKGLMEHNQVETFLHEFGHLIHYIFAGQNEIGYSRYQDEPDFGEAPSMMLQEWVWDYETLSQFATDSDAKVIPKTLVQKMNQARYFGQAVGTATQLTYTAMSLDLYNRTPTDIELDKFERDIYQQYSPYKLHDNIHPYASFGHLTSYGAKYYTYQWSNSIAEELLSKFKADGLRNQKTANDYRYKVLAVTGTKSAADAVKDFLGRDFSVNAYAERLSKTE